MPPLLAVEMMAAAVTATRVHDGADRVTVAEGIARIRRAGDARNARVAAIGAHRWHRPPADHISVQMCMAFQYGPLVVSVAPTEDGSCAVEGRRLAGARAESRSAPR